MWLVTILLLNVDSGDGGGCRGDARGSVMMAFFPVASDTGGVACAVAAVDNTCPNGIMAVSSASNLITLKFGLAKRWPLFFFFFS